MPVIWNGIESELAACGANLVLLKGNVADIYSAYGGLYMKLDDLIESSLISSQVLVCQPDLNLHSMVVDFAGNTDKSEKFDIVKALDDLANDADAGERNLFTLVSLQYIAEEFERFVASVGKSSGCSLTIVISSPDVLFPSYISSLQSPEDRRTIALAAKWLSSHQFISGNVRVVLLAESERLICPSISSISNLHIIELNLPDYQQRLEYILSLNFNFSEADCTLYAEKSAGLSLLALDRILRDSDVSGFSAVTQSQLKNMLGRESLSYYFPGHKLESILGLHSLKFYLKNDFIPRCKRHNHISARGAIVAGPVGSGKNYLLDSVAAELSAPVLSINSSVLNLPYPELFIERLERYLDALDNIFVYIQDADIFFAESSGGFCGAESIVSAGLIRIMEKAAHHGRVFWFLLTTRVDLLSLEIRRQGQIGDLIFPIIDPKGEDLHDYISWVSEAGMKRLPHKHEMEDLRPHFHGLSASALVALRDELLAVSEIRQRNLALSEIIEVVRDRLEPDIGNIRRYQELQALLNCTRKTLLPTPERAPEQIDNWRAELQRLEENGYS